MSVRLQHKVSVWVTMAAIAAAVLACPGVSQAGVEEDIAALRKELAEVKKELAEIKSVLRRARRPRKAVRGPVKVGVAGKPSQGSQNAPVTMVEFSDYQCPYCRRYVSMVFPAIKKDYIETGKVKYVFRDFPIPALHPQSKKAHEAAHCAGEQNQYWKMHDILFENSKDLSLAALKRYAQKVGLDDDKFDDCLRTGRYAGTVEKEITDGRKVGVSGTPSFVIGPSGSGETITGTVVIGAQPPATFKQVIENALKGPSKSDSQ
ncbi:MAG: thioredoxin domain-containing protein [Candidatus Methylomirabilales bacterium]